MQTPVIVVLLLAGSLCIVAQALATVLTAGRGSSAEAKETGAKASSSKASKTKAEQDDSGDPSAMSRVQSAAARIFNVETAERARLGMLGIALLLVAAVLVLDFEFTVTVANITR